MEKLLVINLGNGNCRTGLPSAIGQLWEDASAQPMQVSGHLPGMPELAALQQQWQTLYSALYAHLGWRRGTMPEDFENSIRGSAREFEIDDGAVTHISQVEFDSVCRKLQAQLNQWLNTEGFQQIQRQIRTYLSPSDEIRIVITANDLSLLQLPWHLWQLLEDYPNAEIALSPAEYARSRQSETPSQSKVRILAILGNSQGLDVDYDRRILDQLSRAQIQWLIEPSSEQLQQQLWEQSWDLLFFAGHSSSQDRGCIQINASETLTIDQLKYAVRRAISKGLKLAIFNSCDGLGLAQDLADLRIPQVIVMRQPVPDRVAQAFLTTFLQTFSSGRSLYYSVREAREKLQLLERDFPCATWLPVICQNPAEPAARWSDWCSVGLDKDAANILPIVKPRKSWALICRSLFRVILCSLVSTGLVVGAKSLGWLQPIELASYDLLMRTRPIEPPDPRLLVIALTESDVQAERNQVQTGSLSDQSLDRLLKMLEQAQPRAIGLDLYRDFPTSLASLKQQLQNNDRLITVCKRPDIGSDPIGVLPAPEVPIELVGFSDLVQDVDGAARRQLVAMNDQSTSRCKSGNAFSTLLATRYLADEDINAQFTQQYLQIGQRRIKRLDEDAGGYHAQDAQGFQVMLNYRRTAQEIAQTVTLQQALSGQVPAESIHNRIILIGGVNPSGNDLWTTPFGSGFAQKQPGVYIHAQMISQILSAVQDQRPLIVPSSFEQTLLWVLLWSIVGSAIGLLRQPYYRLPLLGVGLILLWGIGCWSLIRGTWILVGMQTVALTGTTLLIATSKDIVLKKQE